MAPTRKINIRARRGSNVIPCSIPRATSCSPYDIPFLRAHFGRFSRKTQRKIKKTIPRPGRWLAFSKTASGAVCARKTGTSSVRVEARCATHNASDFGFLNGDFRLNSLKQHNSDDCEGQLTNSPVNQISNQPINQSTKEPVNRAVSLVIGDLGTWVLGKAMPIPSTMKTM